MGQVLQFPQDPMINPNMQLQAQMSADIQRIAIGIDMLVGLLATIHDLDLKEDKDEHGNTVLRWRARNAEGTQSKSEESSDSKA